jgi:hypothetical protein
MTELVAVACVVESSLVLASEWSRVLVDYISPLLKRLSEAHTVGSQSTVDPLVLLRLSRIIDLEPSQVSHGLCDIWHSRYPSDTFACEKVLRSLPNSGHERTMRANEKPWYWPD